MMLYENEIKKSFSFLLRFSVFRETFKSLYSFREALLIISGKNKANNTNTENNVLDEDFWDFIKETVKNTKKAKEG
jgi:hypothetical protein